MFKFKIEIIFLAFLFFSVISCQTSISDENRIEMMKKNLFIVSCVHKEPVMVKTGDMVQICTPKLALVPANLEKSFRFEYDKIKLRLVGETLPPGEGIMGKEIYFKAEREGEAFVKVFLLDKDKKAIESYQYKIFIERNKNSESP